MTRTLTVADGVALAVRAWTPDVPAWLHLLLLHGLAEHSGRYERAGRLLADAGIAVTAYDHRGHGASPGRRADVERWSDLTGDASRLLGEVREAAGDLPVALLGHSMGGLVALDLLASGAPSPDLLVLSAPGLGDALPGWQHRLAPLIARLRPTLPVPNAWDGSALSRDPEVGRAVAADPLCTTATTARLGTAAFGAQDRVNAWIASVAEMPVPALVLHGTDDRLVPPVVSQALGRVPGVERRTLPGLRHELLNEPEGPAIVGDIIAWLRTRVAERPAP